MMEHNPDFNRKMADALEAAYEKAKHTPTNVDRIRSMTDEELANWIAWVCYKAYSNWNPHYVQKPKEWLDWLQSSAGGDGDG